MLKKLCKVCATTQTQFVSLVVVSYKTIFVKPFFIKTFTMSRFGDITAFAPQQKSAPVGACCLDY